MSLYENLIALVNKYFYKTDEKPAKYNEWLTSEYVNGVWYICEEIPLIFTFTGTELTQFSDTRSFRGNDMYIDYGDGTIETTTGNFEHIYEENGTYKIKIYGITDLGAYCFRECTGLISISIPNGVQMLGTACFMDCTNLTSINIPNSVTNIGAYYFNRCTGLTSIEIPSSVTSIGDSCFMGCTNLTSIQLNWTGNNILTYAPNWITSTSSNLKFSIPSGTTEYYVQADYPSDKLVESD